MKHSIESLVDKIVSLRHQKDKIMKNFRKKIEEVEIRQLQKDLKNNQKDH